VSPSRSFPAIVVAWLTLVVVGLTVRVVAMPSAPTGSEYAAWSFLGAIPLAVLWSLMRGQSDGSIAQVLFDAERGGQTSATKPVDRG
jgi:hypothetical protein